jgi:5'-3' exonuclease
MLHFGYDLKRVFDSFIPLAVFMGNLHGEPNAPDLQIHENDL